MVEYQYGSIVKMDFSPHAGHEQAGWRRGVIVSNDVFNATSDCIRMVCPLTHTNKPSPYHLKVDGCKETDGYVMCDQMRSVDLVARNAKYVEDAPKELMDNVSTLIKQLL